MCHLIQPRVSEGIVKARVVINRPTHSLVNALDNDSIHTWAQSDTHTHTHKHTYTHTNAHIKQLMLRAYKVREGEKHSIRKTREKRK